MSKIGQNAREKLGLLPEQKKLEGKEFHAIGVQQVEGGWVFVELSIQDGKIVATEKSAVESKGVAVEKFKIESARYLLSKLY